MAVAGRHPFCDIFVAQKALLSKIPHDVIACDLWSPPNQKSWPRFCFGCWVLNKAYFEIYFN